MVKRANLCCLLHFYFESTGVKGAANSLTLPLDLDFARVGGAELALTPPLDFTSTKVGGAELGLTPPPWN